MNREKVQAAAAKYLQQGKYDKALSELKRLVSDDPSDVRSQLKIAETLVKVGRAADAAEAYQVVANLYAEQGFFLKAVAVYKQMLRIEPGRVELHEKLADLHQQLGLTSDAAQHYQKMVVHYEQAGDTQKAIDVMERLVSLDADNMAARIRLGELAAQAGQLDRAVEHFRRAADHLKSQGRMDDYTKVAERLAYFQPSALDVVRELATIYLQRGDAKRALGKLQQCFKADPQDLEVLALIAQAFESMQQPAKAGSVFKEMARVYEQRGAHHQAREVWQRVLQYLPGDHDAENALGLTQPPPEPEADPLEEQLAQLMTETGVYIKYGLKDKAMDHLRQVFSLAPDHLEAHVQMLELRRSAGDIAGERESLARLVQLGQAAGDARARTWSAQLATLSGPTTPPPGVHDDVAAGFETDNTAAEVPASLGSSALHELTPSAELLDDDLDAIDELPSDIPGFAPPAAPADDGLPEDEFDQAALDAAASDAVAAFANDLEELEELGDDAVLEEHTLGLDDADILEASVVASAEGPVVDAERAFFDAGGETLAAPGTDTLASVQQAAREMLAGPSSSAPPMAPPLEDEEPAPLDAASAEPDPFAEAAAAFEEDDAPTMMMSAAELRDMIANPQKAGLNVPAADAHDAFAPQATAAFTAPSLGAEAQDELASAFDSTFGAAAEAAASAVASVALEDAVGEVAPPPPATDTPAATPAEDVKLKPGAAAARFEDDPATQFFPDELEEADFFIAQELFDEAREILEGILDDVPDSPRVNHMMARMTALEAGEPEPLAPWEQDLLDEVEQELDGFEPTLPPALDPMQVPVEEVLNQFKAGVAEAVSEDDAETHFDLGIAYREMGLSEDAISEFELAARAAKRVADAKHMIGLCLLDVGRFDEALLVFDEVLALPSVPQKQRATSMYQRGIALEHSNRTSDAIEALMEARDMGAREPDIAARIQRLEGGASTGAAKTKNIGYL